MNQLTNVHPSAGVLRNNAEAEREYFETLLKSKALPKHVGNYEQAFLIARMGGDLGFSPTQSFQYIVNIQGTLTINAKGIGILLKREGYILKITHDASFVLEDKSFEKIVDRERREDGIYDRLTGKKILDRVTVIQYKRAVGNGMIDEGEIEYYWSDAEKAGLTGKDVWKSYPKAMMMNRCKTKLASYLGLLFLPETEEMAVVQGVNIDLDEEGIPTIIK